MTRRVPWYLVGSLVLVSLAGCGRGFFTAEREAWRAEAEAACMKSGVVKESAALVRISPISGPGACGADYPLKVAALGSAVAMSYTGELRPPGRIPNASNQPRWPINQRPYNQSSYGTQPAPAYPSQGARAPSRDPQPPSYPSQQAPMPLHAPGHAPPDDEDSAAFEPQGGYPRATRPPSDDQLYKDSPRLGAPTYGGAPGGQPQREPYSGAPGARPLPRLGPERNDQVASIGPVAFKPAATLACPMVSALDRWIMEQVQPAALRWFNQPVAEIRQISAYSCRGMNGNSNARISEHAFGNALDISAFTLADGRRISVKDGWRGLPEEQGFLRDVQGAACETFNTVLAPGSNIYHYDHIHVDLMRRSSGRAICNPAAVSGELIAARASGGRYVGRDPAVTGSIGAKRRGLSYRPTADDGIEDESHIKDSGR